MEFVETLQLNSFILGKQGPSADVSWASLEKCGEKTLFSLNEDCLNTS